MCKSIRRIGLTTLLFEVENLAHDEILVYKLILLKIKQFMYDFSITIKVKERMLVKLLF